MFRRIAHPPAGFPLAILFTLPLICLSSVACQSTESPGTDDQTSSSVPARPRVDPSDRERFAAEFKVRAVDDIKVKAQLYADHYPSSNERRIDLFRPHLANLGGAYVGVGTDQNFTFIAWARSTAAYMMDFDAAIVYVNRLHILFLKLSPDYAAFKKMWARSSRKTTLEQIRVSLEKEPDYQKYLQAYDIALRGYSGVPDRLEELEWMTKQFGFRSFHNDPEDYAFIRDMAVNGRIQAVLGDMNGEVTFREISSSASRIGVPVRLVYLSNAEEYFRYPEPFRKTIADLYTDDKGMIIRTVTAGAKEFGYPEGEKFVQTHPFHYNLQNIVKMRIWMRDVRPLWVYDMLKKRKDQVRGFSLSHEDPYECGFLKKPAELSPAAGKPTADRPAPLPSAKPNPSTQKASPSGASPTAADCEKKPSCSF